MKFLLGIVLALVIGAVGVFFSMNSKVNLLREELRVERERKPAPVTYGMLDRINNIELEGSVTAFNCKHQDGGIAVLQTKGIYRYFWNFEHAYGVHVPDDYQWVIAGNPGNPLVATIKVPPLEQLRPIKIEFDRFDEFNRAASKRFQRMYATVLPIARARTELAGVERLKMDPALWSKARASLKAIILPLVNEARGAAELSQFSDISVVFENQPSNITGTPTQFDDNCAIN